MRSRKIAAAFAVLLLTVTGLGTPAKSATLDQTLTALQKNYIPETLSDLEVSTQKQIICLALNQYHEARGSTLADIKAVGFSTRNRVTKSTERNFCSTIWQRGQYEWTKRAVSTLLPREKASWDRMIELARQIVTDHELIDPTGGADSFFSRKITAPKWSRRSPIRTPIGAHVYVQLIRGAAPKTPLVLQPDFIAPAPTPTTAQPILQATAEPVGITPLVQISTTPVNDQ